jgi:Flp pilus assembly protein TadG
MAAPAVAAPVGAAGAQAAQAGLVTVMASDLTAAWAALDVAELGRSLPNFRLLVAAIVRRYGLASATLAARFYRQQRVEAGVTAPFTVRPAPLPPLVQVAKTVDWATVPLWSKTPDVTAARSNLTVSTERLVLDVGRQTITDNTVRDRHAKGWARVTEPAACAFCLMLATRGAVYKQQTADFRTHTNCRCHAEPVFTAYEPSARIREAQALYKQSTAGLSGAAALKAFRQAVETHPDLSPRGAGQ